MTIERYKEAPHDWDVFIKENAKDSGLLQSAIWAVFQKSVGLMPVFLLVKENDNVIAQMILFLCSLPLSLNTIYIPRGPVLKEGTKRNQAYTLLFDEIEKIAKEYTCIYIDIDPIEDDHEIYHQHGYKELPHPRQPQETLILDLTQSEQILLNQMKPKTRYNIRVAQKHGVKVLVEHHEKGKKSFLDLIEQTSKRQDFTAHEKRYYEKMIDILMSSGHLKMYAALYQDSIIAAHVMVYFGKTAIYLHGASAYEYRDKMAPYLLQYHQMMDAKKDRYERYDFWGVSTKGAKQKDWEGITRFKRGFQKDARIIQYARGYRKIMNKKWHLMYRIIQTLRKIV